MAILILKQVSQAWLLYRQCGFRQCCFFFSFDQDYQNTGYESYDSMIGALCWLFSPARDPVELTLKVSYICPSLHGFDQTRKTMKTSRFVGSFVFAYNPAWQTKILKYKLKPPNCKRKENLCFTCKCPQTRRNESNDPLPCFWCGSDALKGDCQGGT